jgi:hypothetical protein
MAAAINLLGILLGALLLLAGLVMIAAQVRTHQIRVYGAGSWVFRGGAVLSAAGLALLALNGGPAELSTVGLLAGVAGLLGGLFTLNHERAQALHGGADRWAWPRSLTLQLMGSGALLVVLALLS